MIQWETVPYQCRRAGREPYAGYVRSPLFLLVVFLVAATVTLVSREQLVGPGADELPVGTWPADPDRPPAFEHPLIAGPSPGARDATERAGLRSGTAPAPGSRATVADHAVAESPPEQVEIATRIEALDERSAPPAAPEIKEPVPVDPIGSPSPPPDESPSEDAREEEAIRRDLSGWVFDQAGEPVAGIAVSASARRLAPASATVTGDGDDRRPTTITDDSGRFGFPQLLDGEYQVRSASTEVYESATAMVRAGVDSTVLVVRAKTHRSLLVRGLVESTRGERLAGVGVIPIERPASAALSDELGYYELLLNIDESRPSHDFRFVRDGYHDLRLGIAGSSELPGVEGVTLDARLEPIEGQAEVTGSVTGSDGLAIQGARLQLYSAAVMRRETAVSDRDGDFVFDHVQPASDYRLWVRPPRDYKDHVEEGLIVDAAGRDLAIVVEALELASLRGQMVDPDGAPVPGISLWLRTAHEGSQRASAVTGGPRGDFLIEQLPEGPLMLQTHASPYFSVSGIELSPGVTTRVRLVLDTGTHELDGFVLDAGGVPVPGALLSLRWSHRESGLLSRSQRRTTTDAGGYFLFTQLGSGRHTLTAGAAGYRGARHDLDVGAASSEVMIHLPEESG